MNWLKNLEQAQSIQAVLDTANDFIAEKPDDYWSWLPEGARPVSIDSEDDLHRWHQALVHELSRVKSPSIPMQDACVFFVRASVRAHQIHLRASPDSNERSFSARGIRRAR